MILFLRTDYHQTVQCSIDEWSIKQKQFQTISVIFYRKYLLDMIHLLSDFLSHNCQLIIGLVFSKLWIVLDNSPQILERFLIIIRCKERVSNPVATTVSAVNGEQKKVLFSSLLKVTRMVTNKKKEE
jgi:hypothetical protein